MREVIIKVTEEDLSGSALPKKLQNNNGFEERNCPGFLASRRSIPSTDSFAWDGFFAVHEKTKSATWVKVPSDVAEKLKRHAHYQRGNPGGKKASPFDFTVIVPDGIMVVETRRIFS